MKSILTSHTIYAATMVFGVLASPAFAHTGHIEAAGHGHSHLLALGAVCAALIVGGFGLLRTIKLRKLKSEKSS